MLGASGRATFSRASPSGRTVAGHYAHWPRRWAGSWWSWAPASVAFQKAWRRLPSVAAGVAAWLKPAASALSQVGPVPPAADPAAGRLL
jgi:hypothetical protein